MEALPYEEQILGEIRLKTGLSFVNLGGIPTREKEVAESVFNAVVPLVPYIEGENLRHGVYALFDSIHAYKYIDTLVEWWMAETDHLAVGTLTQILSRLVRDKDAENLWQWCRQTPPKPFHYMLLAKLASFPSVEREVKEALFEALTTSNYKIGDLEYISSVTDPRIHRWFEGQLESPHRVVRQVARRTVERGKKLPRGVERSRLPPERHQEQFSTEVDLDQVGQLLSQIMQEFRLILPAVARRPNFLHSLELDSWAVVGVKTTKGESCRLWFRLEDIDIVEVVLT